MPMLFGKRMLFSYEKEIHEKMKKNGNFCRVYRMKLCYMRKQEELSWEKRSRQSAY